MKKLSTIQKRENLNEVFRGDDGVGGAAHNYMIVEAGAARMSDDGNILTVSPDSVLLNLQFQHGARKDPKSMHGVLDTDLLEIVRDRLRGFQSGEFATIENTCALTHIEEALMWMNKRVEDRIERNVLGTYQK